MLQHPTSPSSSSSSYSPSSSTSNTPTNNRRIEVVVKQQVRMRSLAIKAPTQSGTLFTQQQPQQHQLTSNNNKGEDDWLSQARYTGCRNDRAKPPYSYASLIAQAILASGERKLTLGEIYQWIMQRYPYYQSQNSGWQNSIRHNLSLNRCFIKLERPNSNSNNSVSVDGTPGKGSYWTIDESLMGELNDSGLFKRRKHRTEKRKRSPLKEVTNNRQLPYSNTIKSPISNNKMMTMINKEGPCNSNLVDEGILRLFTAPTVHEMELPPMEIVEEGGKAHLGNTLACPELTEENFVIPGQVIITSEFY